MKETQTHYGVRLTRETDGVHYLAIGRRGAPELFYWRRAAVKFQRELAEHGLEGKVVRVTAEYIFG